MTAQGVQFGLLGPLEVATSASPIRIGSATSRLLLAVLLVEGDRVVPADRLVEEIWGSKLPADPRAALRTQMSRLRRALGRAAVDLVTEETGYRLAIQRAQLDAARFEDLVADARRTEGEEAAELLREALALWRGPALSEFADRPFAQPYAVHLEALRLEARERYAELLVLLDRAGEAVEALHTLVAEQPGREQARGLLMEALYRVGRHPEALSVYQQGRRYLAEELGLEPSPRLQELERAILEHTLGTEAGASVRRRGRELPIPVSSFVGREDDLVALDAMLDEFRLVTLVGPGGVGKTRLALRTAHAIASGYRHGVWFCDLATVHRSTEVVRAVAAAVGVEERARRPFADQLVDALRGRRMLLVLDNCEHVLDGVAAISGHLIAHTAGIDLLATSRERLAVDGERCWPVRPLATEGDDPPAARLFLERAEAVEPALRVTPEDQATIADICRHLDGLPLAIELAAVRMRGMGAQELARSVDQRFALLTAGPRATRRHRSLEAVVEWSYERLAPAERPRAIRVEHQLDGIPDRLARGPH